MPTPSKGESREDFVGRCIPILKKEGRDQKQSVAICYSMYDQHKKKAKAAEEAEAAKKKPDDEEEDLKDEMKKHKKDKSC